MEVKNANKYFAITTHNVQYNDILKRWQNAINMLLLCNVAYTLAYHIPSSQLKFTVCHLTADS